MGTSLPQNIGPYQLEILIGRGGMGAVYRAYDQRLDRRVAIKHLRPDRQAGEASRRRLRREARAAAALAHPSIVQIFDILEGEDGEWIVMEWINGPSLNALLRQGPLDVVTATQLGHQIAAGLGYAHSQDVIHRDLKVENVIVSPLGQAKILDFGLAKHLDREDDSLTASGVVIGTPRAMSPEQALGLRIDERSDLFSLGVLLYECLSGRSPFRASSSVATLTRVCNHHQEPLRSLVAEIPDDLSRLIDQLLEKQPGHRPRSASRVARQLKKIHLRLEPDSLTTANRSALDQGSDTLAFGDWLDSPTVPGSDRVSGADRVSGVEASDVRQPPSPDTTRSSSTFLPIRQGLLRAAISAVFLILLGAFAVPSEFRSTIALWLLAPEGGRVQSPANHFSRDSSKPDPEAEIAAPVRIVVLPFESLGAAENAYFAAGITEEISRRLTSISGLGVISRTSARRYADGGVSLRQIGRDLDVEYVLEGTVNWPPSTAGDDSSDRVIRITPRLIRVEDDLQIWTEGYERKLEGFLQLQSEIAAAVSTNLDLGMKQNERRALDIRGTEVPDAYYAYLRGLDYRSRPQYSLNEIEKAAKMFEHAVKKDPSFAEAYAELSRAYSFLSFNSDLPEARRSIAVDALRNAKQLAPRSTVVRLASAYFEYQFERDFDSAAEEFASLAADFPNHSDVLAGLALTRRRQGRFAEAVNLLERSFSLDPANKKLAHNIAHVHRAKRDYSAADRWFATTLRIVPDYAGAIGQRALNAVDWHGCRLDEASRAGCSTKPGREILAAAPIPDDPAFYRFLLILDLYDATLAGPQGAQAFYERIAERLKTKETAANPTNPCYWFWYEALALDRVGQQPAAVELVRSCGDTLLQDSRVDATPYQLAQLAIAQAYLGQHENALASIDRSRSLQQATGDLFGGPKNLELSMVALVFLEEYDRALEILERLLQTEYHQSITRTNLRLDPLWDPVRADPRFERLLRSQDHSI